MPATPEPSRCLGAPDVSIIRITRYGIVRVGGPLGNAASPTRVPREREAIFPYCVISPLALMRGVKRARSSLMNFIALSGLVSGEISKPALIRACW